MKLSLIYQLEKLKGRTISPNEIESTLKATGEKIKDERIGKKFRRIKSEAALLSPGISSYFSPLILPKYSTSPGFGTA